MKELTFAQLAQSHNRGFVHICISKGSIYCIKAEIFII